MNSRLLSLSFLGTFLVAIFGLQWWQQAQYPAQLWIVIGIALVVAMGMPLLRSLRRYGSMIIAAVLGLSLALFTVARTTHVPDARSIDSMPLETPVTVTGVVTEKDKRDMSVRYTVRTESIETTSGADTVYGNLLVIDDALRPEASLGDRISVKGTLEHPEAFDGFAYDAYLSRFDIYALMRRPSVEIVEVQAAVTPRMLLLQGRERVSRRLTLLFPEPHAALLDGLLTGNRAGVPETVLQDFTTSGLTHMLAVSGFNITIVIAIITSLLFFVPLRWRLLPACLAIIAFTLFVGASASVVRAAIMGMLGLLALHSGRLKDARLLVLWTAFAMLAWNPKQLWFDPSFQLSFLAVIGLIELQPLLMRVLSRIPETFGIRDALALTIAAQLFAAPWGVLLFGQFSLIAPLANLLAAPLVPLAMLGGSVAYIAGWLWMPFGQVVGLSVWILLELLLTIAKFMATVPLASVQLPAVSVPVIILYYATLIAGVTLMRRRLIGPTARPAGRLQHGTGGVPPPSGR